MEKQFGELRKIVNKILKNLKRNDLDWTVQFSINSVDNGIRYCAQISSPANGLQPITWVCNSYEELKEQLELSAKGLDQEAIDKAYYEAEIIKAETRIEFYRERLTELASADTIEEKEE